ncbi:MAG: NAD(P)H-dependent oxidoreductase [Sneathiellales bacterium]|nr:NAD(P)H-dependent oxidoreductase [Sneathiellales bacterium]
MNEKVLILDGHPEETSFCHALAQAAEKGALQKGAEVRLIQISKLNFNLNLEGAYKSPHPLEPDLQAVFEDLQWCDRLLIIHPLWWGSAPSKLKGLFDRTLRPGEAFHYEDGKPLPVGHFKGKTAQALITSDTPGWYLRLIYKRGWHVILKKQILEFCGFKVRNIKNIGPMRSSTESQREKYLLLAERAGQTI